MAITGKFFRTQSHVEPEALRPGRLAYAARASAHWSHLAHHTGFARPRASVVQNDVGSRAAFVDRRIRLAPRALGPIDRGQPYCHGGSALHSDLGEDDLRRLRHLGRALHQLTNGVTPRAAAQSTAGWQGCRRSLAALAARPLRSQAG